MNIWESTVLTDKGAALQAKLVDGQTLQITRVMTGAVKVPVVNLRQQTSVTDGGKEITLQPSRIEGDKMIVPVLLENKELEKGYDLWQVGIYAQDPDEGEILYCLAQASEAKHIPSVAEAPGFSITWDFCFKTSNTAPFEIHLNSVGLVSIEQYQVHTSEINNLKSSIVNLDERIEDLNSALNGLKIKYYNFITPSKLSTWVDVLDVSELSGHTIFSTSTSIEINGTIYLNSPILKLTKRNNKIQAVTDDSGYINRTGVMTIMYK